MPWTQNLNLSFIHQLLNLIQFIHFLNYLLIILYSNFHHLINQQIINFVTCRRLILAWTWSWWGEVLYWIHIPSWKDLRIPLLFGFIILISWKFTLKKIKELNYWQGERSKSKYWKYCMYPEKQTLEIHVGKPEETLNQRTEKTPPRPALTMYWIKCKLL